MWQEADDVAVAKVLNVPKLFSLSQINCYLCHLFCMTTVTIHSNGNIPGKFYNVRNFTANLTVLFFKLNLSLKLKK